MRVVVDDLDSFKRCGPDYLFQTRDPWYSHGNSERAVAACLVQAVYALDKDRSLTEMGLSPLAPDWYEPFGYKLMRVLHEEDLKEEEGKEQGKSTGAHGTTLHETMKTVVVNGILRILNEKPSISAKTVVGAVFKWSRLSSMSLSRPSAAAKVVIAFRGTIPSGDSLARDLYANLDALMLQVAQSRRYKVALKVVKEAMASYGEAQVSIAGHSLGAAVCLQIGRALALDEEVFIRAHIFNPPFPSLTVGNGGLPLPPLPAIKAEPTSSSNNNNNNNKNGEAASCSDAERDRLRLEKWCPNLYINPQDPICRSYVSYFESHAHRSSSKMGSQWRGPKAEPFHKLPSAHLHRVDSQSSESFMKAHGMKQWWAEDTSIKSQVFKSL